MIINELLTNGTLYALVGAFAGIMAGVLGIGGGMVVVPGLVFLFHRHQLIADPIIMQMAAGTSLAVMIVTAQASVRAHARHGEILWSVFKKLLPGVVIGTLIGALLAKQIPTLWLEKLFGVVILLIAVKMLMGMTARAGSHFPSAWIHWPVTFIIGFKSGLLGIGGGALIIPYLTWCGINLRQISAVSALCTLTVATIGTLTFMVTGWAQPDLPAYATGYIYWPAVLWVAIPSALFAPLGARMTYILPVDQLRYGFVVFLLITAADMLI